MTQPTTARLSGMAQLASALPHLLGFVPNRCLVALVTAPRGSSGVGELSAVLRIDLDDPDHVDDVVRQVRSVVSQRPQGLLHVFVVHPDEQLAESVTDSLVSLSAGARPLLHDVCQVDRGQLLALVRAGEELADLAWHDLPDADQIPAVADLVLQGRGVLGSREELEARVRRRDESSAEAVRLALAVLDLAPDRLDEDAAMAVLGRWVVEGEGEPSARELAQIVACLADRDVRDGVMARWMPRQFRLDLLDRWVVELVVGSLPDWPERRSRESLDRLVGLAARVPEELSVPLLTLAAALAWVEGEGALANCSVEAALERDPGYRMAQLIDHALLHGVDPRTFGRAADHHDGGRAHGGAGARRRSA